MANTKITSKVIADDAILTANITDANVTTAKIAADAITGAKIADDAINSEHYTDGSIDTAHIADDQVTLAKMAGLARGKIIYGDSSGNPAALALGSNGQVLKSDGTDIAWSADSGAVTAVNNATANELVTIGSTTTELDGEANLTFDGSALQVTGTLTVGVDDTGHDVKFFGATASKYMLWDESADSLIVKDVVDAVNFKVNGGQGSDGQVLTSTGSGVAWETPSSFNADAAQTFNESGAAVDFRIESDDDANIFFVDGSEDKIGIGTNAPAEKLHVLGDSAKIQIESNGSDSGVQLVLDGAKTSNGAIGDIVFENAGDTVGMIRSNRASANDAADMLFYTQVASGSNAERLRILSTGDVLIGQTSQTGYTFAEKLVVGDGDANDGITIQSGSTHQGNLAFNHSDGTTAHGRILYQHDTNYMAFMTNNAEKMRIDTNGKVGIGCTPGQLLTVEGATPQIEFRNTANSLHTFTFVNSSATSSYNDIASMGAEIDSGNAKGRLVFRTRETDASGSQSERMRISNAGLVTIGDTAGHAGGHDAVSRLQLTGGGSVLGIKQSQVTDGSHRVVAVFTDAGGTYRGRITINNSACSFTSASDYRLKENIEPLPNGLDRLKQLKPVKFKWKEHDYTSEGFIAHEVQEVYPDAIVGEKDGEEMQSMDYGKITPLLVKAIQEQQEQIEQLKTEIQSLKGE